MIGIKFINNKINISLTLIEASEKLIEFINKLYGVYGITRSRISYSLSFTVDQLSKVYYDHFCGEEYKDIVDFLDVLFEKISTDDNLIINIISKQLTPPCVKLGYCDKKKCCGHLYGLEHEEYVNFMRDRMKSYRDEIEKLNTLKGKIIVIEGLDGSGKNTQTNMLYDTLIERDVHVYKKSFPNYESDSAKGVKMYLNGQLGDTSKVNPYGASVLYASDRFITLSKDLENYKDSVRLFDRYTTSNILFQTSKIEDDEEAFQMVDWIEDLEYSKLKLPKPDIVIFLGMKPETSMMLMQDKDKDEHENLEFLTKVYNKAKRIVDLCGWTYIECDKDGKLLSRQEIHELIMKEIFKIISNKNKEEM